MRELEGVLKQYKSENEKFFGVKERYKASIAGLEKDLAVRVQGAGAGAGRMELE